MKNISFVLGAALSILSISCDSNSSKEQSDSTVSQVLTSSMYREGIRESQSNVGEAILRSKKMCNGTFFGAPKYVQVPGTKSICIDINSGYYFDTSTDVIDVNTGGYLLCTPYGSSPCGGLEKALTTCANSKGGDACFNQLHPYIKRVICVYRLESRGICANL
jgi:hypothetical protein